MRQRVIYPLLRPLLRVLLFRVDRRLRRLPLPVDSPHVHAPGADPDRILLFGSGPAVGYGVLSNDLALPGHLARRLSEITKRGVDIDVVADQEVTIQSARGRLRGLNLWRYDAILLTIGLNNSLLLTSVKAWRTAVQELLLHVAEHVPRRTRILIVAIPPVSTVDAYRGLAARIADRHSAELNRETRRIVSNFPHITFVPFSPLASTDEFRGGSAETYQNWATIIAAPLGQQLRDEPRGDDLEFSPDEEARQAALDALNIVGTEPEERFDRITRLASQLFGTMAAITFLDHDRHWLKSAVGFSRVESPREGSFGEIAIHAAGVYVVEDAAENHDPDSYYGIRFYAGCPIESPFGERVGVISVFSREARKWTLAESELLRDLAIQVQRELS